MNDEAKEALRNSQLQTLIEHSARLIPYTRAWSGGWFVLTYLVGDGVLFDRFQLSTTHEKCMLDELRGKCDGIVLMRYRPDDPSPRVVDLLDLGVITEDAYWVERGDKCDVPAVQGVYIVDGDGNTRDVMRELGAHAEMWCEHCDQYVFYSRLGVPDPDDNDEWDFRTVRHGRGCPWVEARGQMDSITV